MGMRYLVANTVVEMRISTACQLRGISSEDGVGSRSMGPFPWSWSLVQAKARGLLFGLWVATVNRSSSVSALVTCKSSTRPTSECQPEGRTTKTTWHHAGTYAHTFTCLKANTPQDNNKITQYERDLIKDSSQLFLFLPQRNSLHRTKKSHAALPVSPCFCHSHTHTSYCTYTYIYAHTYKCTHRLFRLPCNIPLHHFQVNRQGRKVWLCDENWVACQLLWGGWGERWGRRRNKEKRQWLSGLFPVL